MRGETPQPKPIESKSPFEGFREKFSNRMLVLGAIVATALAVKLGEGKSDAERDQIRSDAEQSFHIDPDTVPPEDQEEVVRAAQTMIDLLNEQRIEDARIDEERSGEGEIIEDDVHEGDLNGENIETEQGASIRIIEEDEESPPDTPDSLKELYVQEHGSIIETQKLGNSVLHEHEDGFCWNETEENKIDPDPTITKELVQNMQSYLSDYFPNCKIEVDSNVRVMLHTEELAGSMGGVGIGILEDGTYHLDYGDVVPGSGIYKDLKSLKDALRDEFIPYMNGDDLK